MISYVLLAAVLVVLAVLLSSVVFRRDRRDDTELFNRAREVTTTWAREHETGDAAYPSEPAERSDVEDDADLGRRP